MNYEKLLNIPYKTYHIFLIIVTGVVIAFLILINIEVSDVYNTYGYIKEGSLVLNIPITYSDTILNGDYLKINEKNYDIELISISNILIEPNNYTNYQEITLRINDSYPENIVVNASIYYSKEKVLTKIKKLF